MDAVVDWFVVPINCGFVFNSCGDQIVCLDMVPRRPGVEVWVIRGDIMLRLEPKMELDRCLDRAGNSPASDLLRIHFPQGSITRNHSFLVVSTHLQKEFSVLKANCSRNQKNLFCEIVYTFRIEG